MKCTDSARLPRHRLAALSALVIIVASASVAAQAATLFHCTSPDGAQLFSDLPCPVGTGPAGERVIEHQVEYGADGNFIDGSLSTADEAHLRRIEQRRRARGGGVTGLADPAAAERCARARRRLDAHRAKARQLHGTSLLERGRTLRQAVHDAC